MDPHRYLPDQFAVFDAAAEQRLDEVASFEGVKAVDDYLDELESVTAAEIENWIELLQG